MMLFTKWKKLIEMMKPVREWNYLHNEKGEVEVDSRLQIQTHSTGREKDAQLCVYVGEQKVVDL